MLIQRILITNVGDPDPEGSAIVLAVLDPVPYWECGSEATWFPALQNDFSTFAIMFLDLLPTLGTF
jgi:hypothetical protein